MQRTLPLLVAVTLVGCSDPMDNPVDDPGVGVEGTDPTGRTPVESMSGSQSGSEDILVCHEAARDLVTDASVAARGAEMAPDEYVTRLSQTYVGQAMLGSDDEAVDVTVEITADRTTLAFVVYADEDWEPGDPVPYGEEGMCAHRYEVDVIMHVTAGTHLDELVSTTAWGWHDYITLSVPAALMAENVTGSLVPTTFDLSESPETFLAMGFESHSSHSLNITWMEAPFEPGVPDEPAMEYFGRIELTAQ